MKQISGEFLEFVLSSQNPAGSCDNVTVWLDEDDNMIYMLIANTSLNYAGLNRIRMCDNSWTDIIFVQSNQHEHVEALSFCEIAGDFDSYCEGYCDGDDIAVCDSLDIAQLCVDYPEQMREYFRQWE
jgi:hypothetical protein